MIAGDLRRRPRDRRASPRSLRGARQCLVGLPHPLGAQPDRELPRRVGARSRVLPPRPRARPVASTTCASRSSAGGARDRPTSSRAIQSPGCRCCEEALALSPIAVRRRHGPSGACLRPRQGRQRPRSGRPSSSRRWPGSNVRSLHYTRSLFSLWLAEGHLVARPAGPRRARCSTRCCRARARSGYRHLEGIAERLLAEALGPDDPARRRPLWTRRLASSRRSEPATSVAKALVTQASFLRAAGDVAGRATRRSSGRSAIFDGSLGTVDGPRQVASLLQAFALNARPPARVSPRRLPAHDEPLAPARPRRRTACRASGPRRPAPFPCPSRTAPTISTR